MTLQVVGNSQRMQGPLRTPRSRLKPKAHQSGYVDGAWWPRSDDLSAELPDLLAVLSVRLGRIDRVLDHAVAFPNSHPAKASEEWDAGDIARDRI
nr:MULTISPECIES: DUF5994 family protein [Mycobacterium]